MRNFRRRFLPVLLVFCIMITAIFSASATNGGLPEDSPEKTLDNLELGTSSKTTGPSTFAATAPTIQTFYLKLGDKKYEWKPAPGTFSMFPLEHKQITLDMEKIKPDDFIKTTVHFTTSDGTNQIADEDGTLIKSGASIIDFFQTDGEDGPYLISDKPTTNAYSSVLTGKANQLDENRIYYYLTFNNIIPLEKTPQVIKRHDISFRIDSAIGEPEFYTLYGMSYDVSKEKAVYTLSREADLTKNYNISIPSNVTSGGVGNRYLLNKDITKVVLVQGATKTDITSQILTASGSTFVTSLNNDLTLEVTYTYNGKTETKVVVWEFVNSTDSYFNRAIFRFRKATDDTGVEIGGYKDHTNTDGNVSSLNRVFTAVSTEKPFNFKKSTITFETERAVKLYQGSKEIISDQTVVDLNANNKFVLKGVGTPDMNITLDIVTPNHSTNVVHIRPMIPYLDHLEDYKLLVGVVAEVTNVSNRKLSKLETSLVKGDTLVLDSYRRLDGSTGEILMPLGERDKPTWSMAEVAVRVKDGYSVKGDSLLKDEVIIKENGVEIARFPITVNVYMEKGNSGNATPPVTPPGNGNSGNATPPVTPPGNGNSGSGSSGGSSGGGSRGSTAGVGKKDSSLGTVAKKIATTSGNQKAVVMTPEQSKSLIAKALSANTPVAVVRHTVSGKTSFPIAVLKSMANQAGAKPVLVHADNIKGKEVTVRLSFSPKNATTDLQVGATLESTLIDQIKALFAKNFTNPIQVIAFDQENFGMSVELAVKLDPKITNTENIVFYSFNVKTNQYQKMTVENSWKDSKGYLHFPTPVGGIIIISQGTLVK